MARAKRKTGRKRHQKAVSLAPIPLGGDHGTGTHAALAGTVLEAVTDEKGANPNNMGRRVRKDAWKAYSLTMKQAQAAQLVRDAYCRAEALSSGGELKQKVQSSPKPDATIDIQCAVISHLVHVTKVSTRMDMKLFDHVLRDNKHIAHMDRNNAPILIDLFKIALDRVARHMRY